MAVSFKHEKEFLIVKINDEIDHHSAEKIRINIDNEVMISGSKNIIFDIENVDFMDSSAIGLIIGRYKLTNLIGGQTAIVCTNNSLNKILLLAGINRIIKTYESIECAICGIKESK